MTIVLGSESFPPNISGVAIAVDLLAEDLAKKGHQVCVFAPSPSGKPYREKRKGFEVIRLRSFRNPFRKGFRVALFPKREVLKEVAKISPDIIHLHDPTSVCTALKKAALKLKIPLLITNHFSLDYVLSYLAFLKPAHRMLRKFLSLYLAKYYNDCDYVICPTETVKKTLLGFGVKRPILAISNGVDLERFFAYSAPTETLLKYHLPANPLVLYVGRIDKDKDIDVLLKAVPLVIKQINAHFVLVGGGDKLEEFRRFVIKNRLERFVSFLGPITHESEDIAKIYQLASLFVIPSRIETQSIVTLEAMASGLPIVAAKAGALPELVTHGKNGFLFPPGDYQMLAEYLVRLLKDQQLQENMGKESLAKVVTHEIGRSFAKVEALYEKVAQKTS